MVLFSAACTCGRVTPASADAPVIRPVLVRNCLRDVPALVSWLIVVLLDCVNNTVAHGAPGWRRQGVPGQVRNRFGIADVGREFLPWGPSGHGFQPAGGL